MEGRQFIMGEDRSARRTWPNDTDPLASGGQIGARLKALYAEIEREPIPSNLLDLLEQLDNAERAQKR
jgi:hypothetical protein